MCEAGVSAYAGCELERTGADGMLACAFVPMKAAQITPSASAMMNRAGLTFIGGDLGSDRRAMDVALS